jgi:hypothetical protein
MELPIAWVLGAGLFLLVLGPFLYFEIKRGKARGHTWFTRKKPLGHSDIGPDTGPRPTDPGGVDRARGARH